jgi:hypothetical protein
MIHDPSIITGNIPGLYNYQIVPQGPFSYEISCYASYNSGANDRQIVESSNLTRLEDCISMCNYRNLALYGSCQAVGWYYNNACLLYGDVAEADTINVPDSLGARLITSTYTFVRDALYILPLYNPNSLGLCTTANNRSYSFDTIAPEYYAISDPIYGPNVVRYPFLYENLCNRHFNGLSAGLKSPSDVAGYASALGPSFVHFPPVSNDDCAKLCNYLSVITSVGQGVVQPGACIIWTFDPTDVGNECKLYNQTDGSEIMSPGIHGGRMINGAVSPPYPSVTNRPAVTGYLPSGLQYVSATAVPSAAPP